MIPAAVARRVRPPAHWGLDRLAIEVPALVAFRLHAGEGRAMRPLVRIVLLTVTVLVVVPAAFALALSPLAQASTVTADVWFTVLLVQPSAWLLFLVSATVSAAASSGGRELMPRAQSAVLPVSPATDHAGTLLLTPLNVAWSVQVAGLFAVVGIYSGSDLTAFARMWAATLAWVVASTCVAQLVGWGVELVRSYPLGDLAVRGLALTALGVTVWVVLSGTILDLVDQESVASLPALGRKTTAPGVAATGFAVLVAVAAVAFVAAVPLVAAISRRAAVTQQELETRPRPSLPGARTLLGLLIALDVRLVTRSVPLRRGAAALVVLPVTGAALASIPWSGITLLPGLVASAAGLLYGVNAFALDGPGAVWRESLPQPPRLWLDARVVVLMMVVAAPAALAVTAASVRTGQVPTPAQAVAVVCALVVAVVQVVGSCARWSVHRPHPASLRSARDTPAPPASMAGYSFRLAVTTTLTALLFALASRAPHPVVPVVLTLPFLVSAWLGARRTADGFARDAVRSRVVAAVSGS